MHQIKGLTRSEWWELGLVVTFLMVICLVLAAVARTQSRSQGGATSLAATSHKEELPRLMALEAPAVQPAEVSFPAAPTAALDIQKLLELPPILQPLQPIQPIKPKLKVVRRVSKPVVYQQTQYRFWKTMKMRVTAYAPDKRCCYPYPGTTTASGLSVRTNQGRLVAADTRLIPFHALVAIPGYHAGSPVPVLDRGGAIKGHRIDVLMPSFSQAQQWGSRTIEISVFLPEDDEDGE